MKQKFNLEQEMQTNLVKNAFNINYDNLGSAIDYLNSAIDIFQDANMNKQADQIISILEKFANNTSTGHDNHTDVTSDDMIENLKHHGFTLNLADDGQIDNLSIDDSNLSNDLEYFEDEKD